MFDDWARKPCTAITLLIVAAVGITLLLRPGFIVIDPGGAPLLEKIKLFDSALPQKVSTEQKWGDLDNPAQDGWITEQFNLLAGEQLKNLGALLLQNRPLTAVDTASLVTNDVFCEAVFPESHNKVYQDATFEILRYSARAPHHRQATAARNAPAVATLPTYSGPDGFAESLERLFAIFRGTEQIRHKAKIIRVEPVGEKIITKQFFSCSGKTPNGMIEQHSTWVIEWDLAEQDRLPKMRILRLQDIELVRTREPRGAFFSDCTESVLNANASYKQQLLQGMNHWFQRSTTMRHERRNGGYDFGVNTPGIAVGDANGDGLEDLYLCQENGLPNRLLLHNPDGTATDVSEAWEADWLQDSRSALFIDWDNDGDQDLAVAIRGGVLLAENINQQRFAYRNLIETSNDTMSLSAADYDNDGDLDLYVCAYNRNLFYEPLESDQTAIQGHVFLIHDANNGARNRLLRNDGDASFTDVTKQVGLNVNNHRYSFAAAWEDFDNDGDQDIYVANDFGRDNLYRNDDGTFQDISEEARIENSASGMGIAWADYNRDGWMDTYVSNMWSSAGHRITHQPQFKASDHHAKNRLQRSARGNTLLKNLTDGSFTDVSQPAHVELGRWAWSNQFVDLNNDGWEDLVVANGYLTGVDDSGDL